MNCEVHAKRIKALSVVGTLRTNYAFFSSKSGPAKVTTQTKADFHAANVSRATDTIRWRMFFFNLHFWQTNLLFLITN